ncbi:MAG: phasin family protein [Pseudomonadota bacterium]
MFAISEQLSRATKAAIDAQLVSAHAFAQAAFDSGATAIGVNVEAFKTSLAAATVAANQILAAKSTQEWLTVGTSQSQQAMERAQAYGRQAASVVQDSRAKFSQVAQQEAAVSKQKLIELVDVVKKAPAAAATPINSFFKSAIDQAQSGYDQMARKGEQAAAELKQAGQTFAAAPAGFGAAASA